MRRTREAEARFGFTMATRSARTLILDQVAGEYNINRRDGCDTPSRVWGGLTATPENVHYAAREKFNELWKRFLELDPVLWLDIDSPAQRVQFGSSVSPAFAVRLEATTSALLTMLGGEI